MSNQPESTLAQCNIDHRLLFSMGTRVNMGARMERKNKILIFERQVVQDQDRLVATILVNLPVP